MAASDGRGASAVDRPVDQREEGQLVALDVDGHRLGRLHRGARRERLAQTGEPGLGDAVDVRVAGGDVGEPRLQRRAHGEVEVRLTGALGCRLRTGLRVGLGGGDHPEHDGGDRGHDAAPQGPHQEEDRQGVEHEEHGGQRHERTFQLSRTLGCIARNRGAGEAVPRDRREGVAVVQQVDGSKCTIRAIEARRRSRPQGDFARDRLDVGPWRDETARPVEHAVGRQGGPVLIGQVAAGDREFHHRPQHLHEGAGEGEGGPAGVGRHVEEHHPAGADVAARHEGASRRRGWPRCARSARSTARPGAGVSP